MTANRLSSDSRRIIGITGPSGSGKSTVAASLAARGALVLDADKIAHKFLQPGTASCKQVIKLFGTGDRAKLAEIVFSDPAKKKALEALIHPLVCAEILEKIAAAKGVSTIVIDAALLIESGLHKICTEVWLITAPKEIRLNRIIARDNIARDFAALRMASQTDPEQLKSAADFVIENNGSVEDLQIRIGDIF